MGPPFCCFVHLGYGIVSYVEVTAPSSTRGGLGFRRLEGYSPFDGGWADAHAADDG